MINCNNYDEAISGRTKKGRRQRVHSLLRSPSEEFVYTENPVGGKNPVNQESQEMLSTVGGTWNSKLIKLNT